MNTVYLVNGRVDLVDAEFANPIKAFFDFKKAKAYHDLLNQTYLELYETAKTGPRAEADDFVNAGMQKLHASYCEGFRHPEDVGYSLTEVEIGDEQGEL